MNNTTKAESLLKEILKKTCPEHFTISGKKGRKLDCFVVFCKWNDKEIILKEYQDGLFQGLSINSNTKRHDIPIKISFPDFKNSDLTIYHYWHGNRIPFNSIKDYRFHRLTKMVYLKLIMLQIKYSITLFFYRRTKMVSPDRMALLRNILNLSMEKELNSVSIDEIIATTLGKRWVSHPNGMKEYEKTRFLCKSLVISNDIIKDGNAYKPAAKALSTLQSYELDERRYKGQVWLQRLLVFATIVIALKEIGFIRWLFDLIK